MKEHEFDQDDVFGVCKNCGKYVEQLIDERYCSMSKENKYPNADTSPGRLAEIEGTFNHNKWEIGWKDVRDLLAMLQERDARLAYLNKSPQEKRAEAAKEIEEILPEKKNIN